MRYTIINFTRFGDLLQTACTVSALKKSGNHTISLICLEQFGEAAAFIPHLDHVKTFSGAKLLKYLARGSCADWTAAYQDLMQWIEAYCREFCTENIINLTPTIKTRLFTKLLSLHIKEKSGRTAEETGFCVNEYGFTRNTNIWTSYTQAVTQIRGGSPYNLIDEFRSMLGLAPEKYSLIPPSPHSLACARKILSDFTANLPETKGFVGFQLGASNPIRQWDVRRFAELAGLLWKKKQLVPVLLGTKQELALAENFSRYADTPFLNYCGQSSLQELAAMLTALQALVSNDTGTLHLATGLGVPVVGIYLATAQVWDTGPYGEKQLCLEPALACHPCNFNTPCPNNTICRSTVSAETVFYALCLRLDSTENGKDAAAAGEFFKNEKNARIWEGFFQEDGFINYKALHRDTDTRSLWMQCQRIFYKNLFANFQQNIRLPYPEPAQNTYDLTPAYLEAEKLLAFLLLTREQAALLAKMPVQKNKEKFLASTERLKFFLRQSRFFVPLSLLFEQMLQDSALDIKSVIHFFDTLKEELSLFSAYLCLPSNQ